MMKKFVLTCGDINGIGPEIAIKTLNSAAGSGDRFYFICPAKVFEKAAEAVEPKFSYSVEKDYAGRFRRGVKIIDTGDFKQTPGTPTAVSGRAAYEAIKLSFDMVIRKHADAVITAPISKHAISMAGINFPGHTEMYAKWSKTKKFVMTFLSEEMNAALATIHEPVERVSSLLTKRRLSDTIDIVTHTLKKDLRIKNPRIAVLGLNPHAGESGLIGSEEIKIIKPVMDKHKDAAYLYGPFSPDAFFANRMHKKFDMVIGMYHDQALIPFKLLNFGAGVNYTAGLPIIRTSPDHGTAYDIAGKGTADASSMMQALSCAARIINNRRKA